MFKTIVVPLDGSGLAEHALPHGVALAKAFAARVVLVRAYDPLGALAPTMAGVHGGYTSAELIEATTKQYAEETERYLDGAAETVQASGLPVETVAVQGSVIESLAEVIEAQPAALVVMTTRGRGGLKRFVLGSVTDALLHRLETPILVVPNRPD
jgi:nucleotide-binding universal stress UspA family protein